MRKTKTIRLHASLKPMPRLINKRPSPWWRRRIHSLGKPVGLWYGINDAWLEWCVSEDWSHDYKHFYDIDVSKANILRLKTVQDILDFHDAYRGDPWFVTGFDQEPGDYTVDWEGVRKRYDGIEISPYQWELRFNLHWYYTWDVACGCVWRMGKVSFRKVTARRMVAKYYRGKESDPCPSSKSSG